MFLLVVCLLALAVGLTRGGQISRLAGLSFRHPSLLLVALAGQVVLFSAWGAQHVPQSWVGPLHVASMGLVLVAVLFNRHLPGMSWLGLGLVLNLIAIAANGGYMPANPQALQLAGMAGQYANGVHNNSAIATASTRLPFLTDVLALPSWLPFANVFSLGDVLIATGAFLLIQRSLLSPANPEPAV